MNDRSKETSCVWRTGCPALIQCAAAGRCLSIPKDLADTQTEVRPSKQKLSCPFCGHRDIRSHHRGHPTSGGWVIECHSCSCELTGFASEQDAWARWNKRPADETNGPFERTAILADPNTMRISIAFQEKEDYEKAVAFFGMGDSQEEPK